MDAAEGADCHANAAMLRRKIRVRGGHRAATTKVLAAATKLEQDAQEGETAPSRAEQSHLHRALKEKRVVLAELDSQILDLLPEDEIEADVEQAQVLQDTIGRAIEVLEVIRSEQWEDRSRNVTPDAEYSTPELDEVSVMGNRRVAVPRALFSPSFQLQRPLARSTAGCEVDQSSPQLRASHSHVKLPTLELPKFDGDISKWETFWDSFRSTVDENETLSDVDKFSYLKSFLSKSAADALEGYAVTSANYSEAVTTLKRRFGNKQAIISRHMDLLLRIEPVTSDRNLRALRRVFDKMECQVRSLKSLGVESSAYGSLLSSILMNKLPEELRLAVSREVQDSEWEFDRLLEVFRRELEARERAAMGGEKGQPAEAAPRVNRFRPATTTALAATQVTCTYCREGHASASCTTVTDIKARKDILRRAGRCYVCLRRGHTANRCGATSRCPKCGRKHHVSICEPPSVTEEKAPASAKNQRSESTKDTTRVGTCLSSGGQENHAAVWLQSAVAAVAGERTPASQKSARLLFDSGSQCSYVTEAARKELDLRCIDTVPVVINTFGSAEGRPQNLDKVRVSVKDMDGDSIWVNALVIPTICEPVPREATSMQRFPHLKGLTLADPPSKDDPGDIDMLIGSDFYWSSIGGEVKRGDHGPTAVSSRLGWILSGPSPRDNPPRHFVTNLVIAQPPKPSLDVNGLDSREGEGDSLNDTLKRFWDLETIGILPRTAYDDFLDRLTFQDGRYEVKLPWRKNHDLLPDNYHLSVNRLKSLWRRLRKEPEVLQEYNKVMMDQLDRGIIEPVEDCGEVGRTHYIPHHPVIRRDKETTKLRVVYDASARSTGPSLNDCLQVGPPMNHMILDIILRFRTFPVALSGDLEKAFLMVSVAKEDRDVLRFLWTDDVNTDEPTLKVYRFARVMFGVASSPFLLNATLRQHLDKYEGTDPEFVTEMLQGLYVDDINTGAADAEKTFQLYLKAKARFAAAGFNLRKFVTNSYELRQRILEAEEALGTSTPNATEGTEQSYAKLKLGGEEPAVGEHKVLGVRCDVGNDQLVFDLSALAGAESQPLTKRTVISHAAKVYDPLGILSPATLKLKVLFQRLCEDGCGWDEEMSAERQEEWRAILRAVNEEAQIRTPRHYLQGINEPVQSIVLHGFADASSYAYGAVVYARVTTATQCHIRFLAAKARVAPLKKQSIPRLELLAALILSRLVVNVKEAIKGKVKIDNVICWTDSMDVWHWVTPKQKEWKQFVQNRVDEIVSRVPATQWRHCPGVQNPADIVSRGMSVTDMMNSVWVTGPEWLKRQDTLNREPEPSGRSDACLAEKRKSESKQTTLVAAERSHPGIGNVINISEFNSLRRLLRVTVNVLKFCRVLKSRMESSDAPAAEVDFSNEAQEMWIREAQLTLEGHPQFAKWSHQLELRKDDSGVWRCGGRLQGADIPEGAKSPILIPSEHPLAELIVTAAHARMMHSGLGSTLAEVRTRFWIVRGRQLVKRVLRRCVTCRRYEGAPFRPPRAPPLPDFRVKRSQPFEHVGMDFAGPLYVYDDRNSPAKKTWILLLTCAVTRAVHLELVTDLTTEAFIRGFRKFTARRGMPGHIVTDNGQTFKAADRYFRAVAKALDRVTQGPKWSFNLERAPWWGGMFERLVKSVKGVLRKTIGSARLTTDELSSVLAEVEQVINSRPLSYISSDDTNEVLTPFHLIFGRRLPFQPATDGEDDMSFNDKSGDLTRRLAHLTRILQHWWNRWRDEYLLELRTAHAAANRRATTPSEVRVGEVVIIFDKDAPRGKWRMGVVEELLAGRDGKVRGAVIKTVQKSGRQVRLRRAVQHLYPLEVQEEGRDVCDSGEEEQAAGALRRSTRTAAREAKVRLERLGESDRL